MKDTNYHPKHRKRINYKTRSWSEHSRNFTDCLFDGFIDHEQAYEIALKMIQSSYRAPIICKRAAKRLGRLMEKYKKNKISS